MCAPSVRRGRSEWVVHSRARTLEHTHRHTHPQGNGSMQHFFCFASRRQKRLTTRSSSCVPTAPQSSLIDPKTVTTGAGNPLDDHVSMRQGPVPPHHPVVSRLSCCRAVSTGCQYSRVRALNLQAPHAALLGLPLPSLFHHHGPRAGVNRSKWRMA